MKLIVLAAIAAIASPANTPDDAFFGALRTADTRLATIAERLTTANVALCDQRQPAFGMVLHGLRQYRESDWPTVRRVFGFNTPVAVEAIVEGGAAQRAGVAPNDGVLAIGDHVLPVSAAEAAKPASTDRDGVLSLLDAAPSSQSTTITFDRNGAVVRRELVPRAACRSRFEIVVGNGFDAQADGVNVQLGERFFEGLSDEEIAVVVSHELAHNILRHRARLDAAGVKWGILSEFGKNAALFRKTEDEADLLGMYLLRNAGFDPSLAVQFWLNVGARFDGGIFRSRTHGSSKARAAAIEAEIARIPKDAPIPYSPAILAQRDRPLAR